MKTMMTDEDLNNGPVTGSYENDIWAIERRILELKIDSVKKQAERDTRCIRERMYLEGKLPLSDFENEGFFACDMAL
jgi:hypothetical protein